MSGEGWPPLFAGAVGRAVLSAGACFLSLAPTVALSVLAHRAPRAPNQTSRSLFPMSCHWMNVGILDLLLLFWDSQSSCLGQARHSTFRCAFSFLQLVYLLQGDLMCTLTPPIAGWQPSPPFGQPAFPHSASMNFRAQCTSVTTKTFPVLFPELVFLPFAFKDYFMTLIDADTVVSRASLWSVLSTFWLCFSCHLRVEHEGCFWNMQGRDKDTVTH